MRKSILLFILFFTAFAAQAQYWFGPTVGFHLADHSYLSSTYDTDSFKISPNLNFHAGASFTYTANNTYSVYGELLYERIGKRVKNITGVTLPADSKSQYHFISTPIMLRVNFRFGGSPVSAYVGGGTKLSYWLGGNGEIELQQFEEEFGEDESVLEYRMVYKQRKSSNKKLAFIDANRLQYSLQLGGGLNFDIVNESRIFLDFRFTFGHSNMGFNGSPNFEWDDYYENFEYRHHLYALSVGYILQYNAQLARKGKSTIKESNR